MPPAAAMWFSLISTASYKPMRWFTPPPVRTAYFCASRKPGMVLRVSTMTARLLGTLAMASTNTAVLLATALISCKKFNAVRSAVSKACALPSISSTTWSTSLRCPSWTCQTTLASGSSASTAALAQACPHITTESRANTRARARRSGSTKAAVRSPAPTSSVSARATSAWARPLMEAVEKSKYVIGVQA